MSYNIFFDIAALVNLAVVFYAYTVQKKLPEAKNFAFLIFGIVMFFATVVDILTAYAISYPERYSIAYLYFINCLYFLFIVSLSLSFCLFSIAFVDEHIRLKKKIVSFAIFVPYYVVVLLIFLSPFFHIVFKIDENHIYSRQPGLYGILTMGFLYIVLGIIFVARAKETVSRQSKMHFYLCISFAIASIVLQMFFPEILIQDYGISVSILLLYYLIQDKDVIISGTTGLLNQNAFNILTSRSLKKKEEFCVISLFIDDLQFLTTTFGIDGISSLLRQIAVYLMETAPDCKVFHLTNDNFCVVIPNAEAINYSKLTNEFTERFNSPWKNELIEIKLNVRLCVIRCPYDAETAETILDTIHTVIDEPKYRGAKLLFAEKIDVNTKKRYAYISQLVRTAIQEQRIEVYYQPLYSVSEQRIIGAEALVRMRDHEGNFISPEEFVPIAEQNGQILRIGLFVYEDVCRFISSTHLKEYGIRMIDVNLSVAQCMQTHICEELYDILNSYNLDTSILNLEITETAAAQNMELLYSNMQKLSSMGFSCSLDDYGSGYANLNYMLHMAFSLIKIDKDIVWTAMRDVHAYIMLVGIIDMVHKLDMKIVAEGIETQEMVDRLTQLHCDYFQGFYYSRPIPEKEFFELVKKQAEEKGLKKNNFDEIFPEHLYPVIEPDGAKNEEVLEELDGVIEDLVEVDENDIDISNGGDKIK